jgi:uncharacterized membrane protein YkoI
MRRSLPLLVLLALAAAGPVQASTEDEVRRLVMAGEILPFEKIRDRVFSQPHGNYIGADFDLSTRTYRFRFLEDGNVINVDIDARNGNLLNRKRNY